jgi:chemotaxis protein methyltransferase CheR
MRITDEHVSSLAHLLRERVGFEVRAEGYNLLRTALADRLRDQEETDVGRYLRALYEREEELERLLPLVTIGKTSFFRDPGQFRALASLLPGLLAEAREEGRRLAIWSAGCASGEEVYSIAITLLEAGAAPYEVELLATDVNPEAIAASARGRYREDRMAPVSEERLSRFFVRDGDDWVAGRELRAMIAGFQTHNLNSKEVPLPASGAWDVIFCRNVLIYFDRSGIQAVAGRLFASLRPGGWLLLGYSESLFKLFDGFELVELHGSFLYRRPPQLPVPAPSSPPLEELAFDRPLAPARKAPPPRSSAAPNPEPKPERPRPPEPDPLDRAVALIERGEFLQAAEVLELALASAPGRLELRVTLGNVYALLRRHDEAEACFEKALSEDPLAPEALLYQGLFFLERSRYTEAERALSRVVYLEPDFALAHYLLGRCQERQRRLDGARRSYRNALRSLGTAQRPLRAFYPDLPKDPDKLDTAARLALAAL